MLEGYDLISVIYGNRRAKRSGVLYMKHIDMGLYIMTIYGASKSAKDAFCLHPIVQKDTDLQTYLPILNGCNPVSVALAMEYRHVANAFLSDKITSVEGPHPEPMDSVLTDVNLMLIGDKVQNYWDFMKYHKDTHPRSKELDIYFNLWLTTLNIDSMPNFLLSRWEEQYGANYEKR